MGDNPMMALFGGGATGAHTDGEGRFRLEPLAAGRLQLLATAEGFASHAASASRSKPARCSKAS
jgi:hypothetical protein